MYVTERMISVTQSQAKKDQLKGVIAQMGERLPCTQEVRGSIPRSSTNWLNVTLVISGDVICELSADN